MGFTARSLRPWLFSTSLIFIGWLIGTFVTSHSFTTSDSSTPEQINSAPPVTTTQIDDTPFIAADAKGNITVHVENQPLTWVLEQIQLKSGRSLTQYNQSPSTPSIELPSCSAQQSSEEILTKIQEGDESERYNTLVLAQQRKIKLPEETLKTLYETDRSLHVRLLAYAYALETFSGDSTALRNTLEDARSLPDRAIANDAEQRLAALTRLEIQREKAYR